MCNEIALRVHCRPGDEMLAHRTAHPIHFEGGGPAALAGVNVSALDGPRGRYDPDAVAAAIRPESRYMPRSRLLWVEQTSNLGGGSVWPLARITAVTDVARRRGLSTHLDGARLMNAVVATGVAARDYAAPFDSAWIDFTKGLGAPVGAALAGSRDFIADAWRLKQQMGGAMRQAGIFFEVDGPLDAEAVVAALLARGVRMGVMGPRTIRAVTHLDVDAEKVERALEAAGAVLRA
jgi:threonine aldolase